MAPHTSMVLVALFPPLLAESITFFNWRHPLWNSRQNIYSRAFPKDSGDSECVISTSSKENNESKIYRAMILKYNINFPNTSKTFYS